MFECKWCGSEVPLGEQYCPKCGNPYVPSVSCPFCKTDIPIGVRLCSNCGMFVEESAQAAAAVAPPPDEPTQAGKPGGQSRQLPPGAHTPGATTSPPGARPQAGVGRGQAAVTRSGDRPMWMGGPKADPWYIVALGISVLAMAFFWIPRANIIFSVIALILVGIGFYRYFRLRGEYGHVWLNIIAVVIGLVALILAIRSTIAAENLEAPAIIFFSMLPW
jgi:hypothetical protein